MNKRAWVGAKPIKWKSTINLVIIICIIWWLVLIPHASFAIVNKGCQAVSDFYQLFISMVPGSDRNFNFEAVKVKYQNIFGNIVSERYAGELEDKNDYCSDKSVIAVNYDKGAEIMFIVSIDDGSNKCVGAYLGSIEYTGQEALLPLGVRIGDDKIKIIELFGQGSNDPEMRGYYSENAEGMDINLFGCDGVEIACYFRNNRLVKIKWELFVP